MKKETAIFQVQIPAKLILFGEWAVLQGYPALGCSVGKYFNAELIPQEIPSSAINIESEEVFFTWEDIYQKSPPFLEKTCSILSYLFENPFELKGHTLRLIRNWKLSEGLGSSSALFLALAILKGHRDQKHPLGHLDPQKRATPLLSLLRPEVLQIPEKSSPPSAAELRKQLVDFQGSGSGFDLLLQACGGFLSARIDGDKTEMKKENLVVPEEILFVHTGKKMKTDLALGDFKDKKDALADYSKVIGKSSEDFLAHKDWPKTMREHDVCLKKMGVVPNFVQELKEHWLEKKWITELKTTGAGGGDTLMLFINTCKRPELEADLLKKGYWLEEASLGVKGALESNL